MGNHHREMQQYFSEFDEEYDNNNYGMMRPGKNYKVRSRCHFHR